MAYLLVGLTAFENLATMGSNKAFKNKGEKKRPKIHLCV